MSQVAACPNCKTRYNLPESAIGKRFKCKSCGKPFSASAGSTQTSQSANRNTSRVAGPSKADVAELQKMGIASIKSQPDIFPAEIAPGPDPLRNHVVQDPGFSLSPQPENRSNSGKVSDGNDFENVVENPHLKGGAGGAAKSVDEDVAERRRREEKILKAYSTPSSDATPKRKKKKKSQDGLTRLSYFFASMGLGVLCNLMIVGGSTLIGYELKDANANPADAPTMFLVMFISAILILAVGHGLLVRGRFINMALPSPKWADIAGGVCAAPSILFLCAIGGGFLTPILAWVFLIAAGVLMLVSIPVYYGCLIFPPKYWQTKQLDVTSYIWIGLAALSLLPLVFALVSILL